MPKQRGRHQTQRLSARFVQTAPPGVYCDGHGLNLRVNASGSRQWVQRLVIRGRPRSLGLGGYPLVSLAEARSKAFANRKLAREGGDPLAEKHRARGMPTFGEAAALVLKQKRVAWRNPKHAKDWPSSLRRYVFPYFGDRPVGEIGTSEVLKALEPIWHEKPETARRVRQRIGAVMKWAVAMEYRPDNPAGDAIGQALGRQGDLTHHFKALPHAEVAGAVASVHASSASAGAKLCFEFLVLTAARVSEARLATWGELDLEGAVWTVPAERMKANREHRVPLSGRAVEVLNEARALSVGEGWVFPGTRPGKPLSNATHSKLMRELGIDAVPHGFRSSFRDWAQECTHAARAVQEKALSHVNPNKVEAAYARSELFEQRRTLMQQWAQYLSTRSGDVVVPMVRRG